MKKILGIKSITASLMAAVIMVSPLASIAQQTRIKAPSNKYSVQDDVKLGRQAAVEIERKMTVVGTHWSNTTARRTQFRMRETTSRVTPKLL